MMRNGLLYGLLFLGLVRVSCSQSLSFGVKAGAPLTDALSGFSSSAGTVTTSTNGWLVGPTVEFHLPFRLLFEVDALYRRESYRASTTSASVPSGVTLSEWFQLTPNRALTSFGSTLSNWQIPLLAKYELKGGLVRPFVDGGLTYRHLSGSGPISNPNSAAVTLGGGLTLKLLLLRLSPELRYSRWGNNNLNAPYVTSSQSQADLLVGFTF